MTKPSHKPKLPGPLVGWARPIGLLPWIRGGRATHEPLFRLRSTEVGTIPAALVPLPRALKRGETVEVRIVRKKVATR